MEWTSNQREALAREYARVGFGEGELIPSPADPTLSDPETFLSFLRSIPAGAGVPGFLQAMRLRATPKH